jgi:hypothetical protein
MTTQIRNTQIVVTATIVPIPPTVMEMRAARSATRTFREVARFLA